MTPKAPNARRDEFEDESGMAEMARFRHTKIPATAPQTKRSQNSSLSVFGMLPVFTLIGSFVEVLVLCPLRLAAC
jgi:hypothetical protein